jgi:hypothetical protein
MKAFDGHHIGKYPQIGPAYWFDRVRAGIVEVGVEWEPTEHFGRRCLEPDEMEAAGFAQDGHGRWGLIAHRDHARQRFLVDPGSAGIPEKKE